MANIPIREMTQTGTPSGTDFFVFDNGTMRKAPLSAAAEAVRPVASQSEAQAGADNVKTMTALRTKQSIAAEVGVSVQGYIGGIGAGVAAWLASPSSANLRGALTDETGTGPAVFGTSPNITTPTGILKSDVGLGNVDNTSDAAKNAAAVALTNKTLALGSNTVSGTLAEFNAALSGADFATLAGSEILSGKTLASPAFTGTASGTGTIPGTMLANTGVSPGTYANTNLTVDAQGRVTAASNGTGGGGSTSLPFKDIKADYGAKGDGVSVTATVTIASGSGALTATGASFVSGDVGKLIAVPGAGTAGRPLLTTIASFTDAAHIGLTAPAATAVSAVSKIIQYASDDTSAFNISAAAASAGDTEIYIPRGYYGITTLSPIATNGLIFQGAGQYHSVLQSFSATGDIVTFAGTSQVWRDLGLACAGVRTSGSSIKTTGNSNIIQNFSIWGAYVGLENTGVLNMFENGSVTNITSRNVAAESGGILNSGTIAVVTNVAVGSGTGVNADMAEYGVKLVNGEIDAVQAFAFLCNIGIKIVPGAGQVALGVNLKGCWFDSMISAGMLAQPQHSTAILSLVWASDCWFAPGQGGASGQGVIVSNTVGATIGNLFFTACNIISYANAQGYGVLVDTPVAEFNISNSTIGSSGAAFYYGVSVQPNSTKWSLNGNSIGYNVVGVDIGTGCDKYIINANRILNNTLIVTDSSTPADAVIANNVGYAQPWRTFTSTVTPSSGSFTATGSGRYRIDGKKVSIAVAIGISAPGTAGGNFVLATLPPGHVVGAGNFILAGRDNGYDGALLQGMVNAGSSNIKIARYDNTTPGTHATQLLLSGEYELT